jgi:hypothetical protein
MRRDGECRLSGIAFPVQGHLYKALHRQREALCQKNRSGKMLRAVLSVGAVLRDTSFLYRRNPTVI